MFKFILKLILYFFLVLILFIPILAVSSSLDVRKVSLNQRIQGSFNPLKVGGYGQTLKRFRDFNDIEDVDILFAGSSHAYRGFDPRLFAKPSFNAGTISQTPLNTYFLLKKIFKNKPPKITILELYPRVLVRDGYEGFVDIAKNTDFSIEIIEMAASLKSILALKTLAEIYFDRLKRPIENIKQEEIEGEVYVRGGYCESKKERGPNDKSPDVKRLILNRDQIKYIEKIINLCKRHNIKLLSVIHPLPKDYIDSISNYEEIISELKMVHQKNGIPFYDFNDILNFGTHEFFKDADHLNSKGVKAFNKELIGILQRDFAE